MSNSVSVVIPTYNCETYITETIDCVLSQDYPNIELLIINDGSTDKTEDIIRAYGSKLTLINQANAGVCVARNHGLREATGQYICFMDHDDYWYPDKISRQVKILEEHVEMGVVYSNDIEWLPNPDGSFPAPDTFRGPEIDNEIDHEFSGWIYPELLLNPLILTSSAMFRTEVLKECGSFDENLPYSEDWDLWLSTSRKYQFIKMREATTLYRQHHNQGNRIVRPIDYRTQLLIKAKNKWGLCAPNGKCLPESQFKRRLAEYHSLFGGSHLQAGNYKIAFASFLKAWLTYPINLKYLLYILAGSLGWKPN